MTGSPQPSTLKVSHHEAGSTGTRELFTAFSPTLDPFAASDRRVTSTVCRLHDQVDVGPDLSTEGTGLTGRIGGPCAPLQ